MIIFVGFALTGFILAYVWFTKVNSKECILGTIFSSGFVKAMQHLMVARQAVRSLQEEKMDSAFNLSWG